MEATVDNLVEAYNTLSDKEKISFRQKLVISEEERKRAELLRDIEEAEREIAEGNIKPKTISETIEELSKL